tara:strand:+ start:1543 stop:2772 length:1230 start_codon:yes stop_codon:yes gene_type:complete
MKLDELLKVEGPLAPHHPTLKALSLNTRGYIANSSGNIRTIYNRDPRKKNLLRYNGFSRQAELDGKRLDDHLEMQEALWLSDVYGMNVKPRDVGEVMTYLSEKEHYHPVQQYLHGLAEWDGAPRLKFLFTEYFNATLTGESEDEKATCADLLAEFGVRFMMSAVARAMTPGCKADAMVILMGKQGAGKSQACRILSKGWFSDAPLQIGDREAVMALHGVWLYEVAELDSFRGRAAQKIKAFLSTSTDRYRGMYSRHYTESPRGCVFIGTTNEDHFLRDSTGNRRFWPVHCGNQIDLDKLKSDVDQLWAEALHLYANGTGRWYLDQLSEGALLAHQTTYVERDPWEAAIIHYMAGRHSTMSDILTKGVKVPVDRQDKRAMLRAAAILRQNGYASFQTRIGNKRLQIWRKP